MTNQPPGENIGGDYIVGGIKQTGNRNSASVTTGDQGTSAEDFAAMLKFVELMARNINDLGLAPDQKTAATQVLDDFNAAEPTGDRSRLQKLAASLRAILEQTAGNMLAMAILQQWKPW